MGEFGYQPPRIRLLDAQLTLDPSIVAMMGEIEAQMSLRGQGHLPPFLRLCQERPGPVCRGPANCPTSPARSTSYQ